MLKEKVVKVIKALKNHFQAPDDTNEMEKREKKGLRTIWIIDFAILVMITFGLALIALVLSKMTGHYFALPRWVTITINVVLALAGFVAWWKIIVMFLTSKKWRMVGQIPAVHYGVPLLFGRILPFTVSAGLVPRIPLILDYWSIYEGVMVTDKEITVNAKPPNRQEIIVPITVEWKADRRLSDNKGRNAFVLVAKPEEAIIAAIESATGDVAGNEDGDDFISQKTDFGNLLNALLRLENPPHLHHNSSECGVVGCSFPDGVISADKLLAFYKKHASKVTELLEKEYLNNDNAESEKANGVDIRRVFVKPAKFSSKTQETMEKSKQAGIQEEMAGKYQRMLTDMMTKGATFQEAVDAIQVLLHQNVATSKKILSIELPKNIADALGKINFGKGGGDGR